MNRTAKYIGYILLAVIAVAVYYWVLSQQFSLFNFGTLVVYPAILLSLVILSFAIWLKEKVLAVVSGLCILAICLANPLLKKLIDVQESSAKENANKIIEDLYRFKNKRGRYPDRLHEASMRSDCFYLGISRYSYEYHNKDSTFQLYFPTATGESSWIDERKAWSWHD